jgi:hypothetical protein
MVVGETIRETVESLVVCTARGLRGGRRRRQLAAGRTSPPAPNVVRHRGGPPRSQGRALAGGFVEGPRRSTCPIRYRSVPV